jgi:hypothetical protein
MKMLVLKAARNYVVIKQYRTDHESQSEGRKSSGPDRRERPRPLRVQPSSGRLRLEWLLISLSHTPTTYKLLTKLTSNSNILWPPWLSEKAF